MLVNINRIGRRFISKDLIKKQHDQLKKLNPTSSPSYPKTFEEKQILLNHPNTIQLLEIFQYGVKYPKGNYLVLGGFISISLFLWALEYFIPINIADAYFRISAYTPKFASQKLAYLAGYFFATFNFQSPAFIYLPLALPLLQMTKFVKVWKILALSAINTMICSYRGQQIVNDKLKQYEVWENEYISYGEGTLLSIGYSLWASLGLKNGFTHLKSKVFLKAIAGIGIVRTGIPIASLCLVYTILEIYFHLKEKKNSELTMINIGTGILFGLLLRKFSPIIK